MRFRLLHYIPVFVVLLVAVVSLATAGADRPSSVTPYKTWVYFSDHGERSAAGLAAALEGVRLSQRSMDRRSARGARAVTDTHDLPVNRLYLDRLRATGCSIKRSSKYLNAVSVVATPEQLRDIQRLPFVSKVAPVRRYTRKPVDPAIEESGLPAAGKSGEPFTTPSALDYGASYNQVNQINVIPMHDAGYDGEGLMVGLFDTGFNRSHISLQHIDVEAEWDFVFDDGNTRNESEDVSSQHNHGTQVLSAMAGYAPGSLIGPAYAATFVLAKTERMFEEVQGEEDDFVAALEWADSIGVDLITSSLGYFDWYTFADLDGNTAVITIACDIAASKGITMVVVAGNERNKTWGHIITPADGDSVITVGAVDAGGNLAVFSSPGPTYDGRIKPDVMAMGVSTRLASPWDSLGFITGSGTSFSTPLVAGACVLLLEMHAGWGPMDVRTALRAEASNSASPNNDFGWGIIDAYQSALNGATGIVESMSVELQLNGFVVNGTIFNGDSSGRTVDVVRRQVRLDGMGWEAPETITSGIVVPGSSSANFSDKLEGGGVFEYRIQLSSDPSQITNWSTIKLPFPNTLAQNAPNPFVVGSGLDTAIRYTIGGLPANQGTNAPIESYSEVLLEIYDVRGARVATLVDGIQSPREYETRWNGFDSNGNLAASGVYFYRLKAGGLSMARKMVVIRR